MSKIKEFLINNFFPFIYALFSIGTVRNEVLFIEIRQEGLTINFKSIVTGFRRLSPYADSDIKVSVYNLRAGKSDVFYFMRCLVMVCKLAKVKYAFIDDSSNVIAALHLRKETLLVQTWHGCGALKKFGHSIGTKGKYYGNEKIMTVSSDCVIDYYTEATGLARNRIYAIGVPRTDIFFQEKYKQHCKLLREKILSGRNKQVILYAPTFRGNVGNAKDAPELDIELMEKELGQEYILLIKKHSAIDYEKKSYDKNNFYMDITKELSIEEAMGICDILITDYSSLIFEYSLMSKPALFYVPDIDEYIRDRGFYIDYEKEMPGEICKSTTGIITEIKSGAYDVGRMKRFKEKYMSRCDGKATRRLFNVIADAYIVE